MRTMCRPTLVQRFFSVGLIFVLSAAVIQAQSTRPRRTGKTTQKTTTSSPSTSDPLLRPEPQPSPTARRTSPNDSLLDVKPVKPVVNTVAPADMRHAYQ